MGCGCGGKNKTARRYKVDLPAGTTFKDGASTKTFSSMAEANIAIAGVGMTGKVRPQVVTG